MGAELKSLEAELVEVRSVLEEAATVAERFRAPRERGAREEWLVRMLGAAALARLRAGDPLGTELLAEGRALLPEMAWMGEEQVLRSDGYCLRGTSARGLSDADGFHAFTVR